MVLKIGYGLAIATLVSIGVLLSLQFSLIQVTPGNRNLIVFFIISYFVCSVAAPIFIGIGKRRVILGIVAGLFQIFGLLVILLVKPRDNQ